MDKHGIRIPENYAACFRDTNIRKLESVNRSAFSVKHVDGSCQPCQIFADIMLSNEYIWRGVWICKNILCRHQYRVILEGNKESWLWSDGRLKALIMARDYRDTCRFIDFTPKKTAIFPTKRQMIKCWIFPNTLVECGRWSIIGSRIVPSSQKLATFCHHPSVQIKNTRPCKSKGSWKSDNLKSKIGFTGPCSGLRIQTYWSNRANNWRGQLNGENMSWIKQRRGSRVIFTAEW